MVQRSWSSGRPAGAPGTPQRRRTDQPEATASPSALSARGRRGSTTATALARAATALLECADRPAIARVLCDAAEQIAKVHGHGSAAVWFGQEQLRPAAVSVGLVASGNPRPLSPDLNEELSKGRGPRVDARLLGVARSGGGELTMELLPLRAGQRVCGALGVARRRPCARRATCGCWEALEGLAAQASAALAAVGGCGGDAPDRERLGALLEHTEDVVALLDRDGAVLYVNEAGTRMLGYPTDVLRQLGMPGLLHAADVPAWRALLTAVVGGERQTMRCRLQHADRSLRHAELRALNLLGEPEVRAVAVFLRDITASALSEVVVAHRATHDHLTELPKRALLLERIAEAIVDPDRRNRLAVLSLDLDHFSALNLRLGHAGGDLLLIDVAERLREHLPAATCIARLTGDEFAVLLEGLSPSDLSRQAESIANRLLIALKEPRIIEGESVTVSASIGVAVGVDGLEDAEDLLHRADLAMYAAKATGRGRSSTFHPVEQQTRLTQQLLQHELPRAFSRDELEVRYQPVVSLSDGEVVAAEALLRWRHPRRGLLGPATFLPLAEAEGLADDVFDLVLARACAQVRRWQERLGLEAPSVAVNLSPRQLQREGLVGRIDAALRAARVPASCLTLEVGESVLLEDAHGAALALTALKELGVGLAIDDFGKGYSSLAYLRALPVDLLKLDRAFVRALGNRDPSGLLARTVIDLGHRLGLKTVAEGVERAEQLELLRQHGCDLGQGYLFARPLPGDGVDELVSARSV